jgi:hypothetical protein
VADVRPGVHIIDWGSDVKAGVLRHEQGSHSILTGGAFC